MEVPAIPKLSEFKLDVQALKNKKNKSSILDDYPDYPQRDKLNESSEEHKIKVREYFKAKGLKHIEDFSENEIKFMIEENTMNLIGPLKLSQKFNTMPFVVNHFVRNAGLTITPDDLSLYPNLPKFRGRYLAKKPKNALRGKNSALAIFR